MQVEYVGLGFESWSRRQEERKEGRDACCSAAVLGEREVHAPPPLRLQSTTAALVERRRVERLAATDDRAAIDGKGAPDGVSEPLFLHSGRMVVGHLCSL